MRCRGRGEKSGVRCQIQRHAGGFRANLHPDLKAEFSPVWKDLASRARSVELRSVRICS